jgi:hypothetical protein
MRLTPAIWASALGGLVAASPAAGLEALPPQAIGQVQISVQKQDVLNVIAPVGTPGTLTAVATYKTVEGETTTIGQYEITYSSVQAGQTIRMKLAPGRKAERLLRRRGNLTVFVSVALHDTAGALSNTTPRKLVLHTPQH